MASLYLIDTLNNNKVVDEFENQEEVNEYLNKKEYTKNWKESVCETFEEWKEDSFFTVTSEEMKEAVYKQGSRKKNYWT